jgi:hypothetical protein
VRGAVEAWLPEEAALAPADVVRRAIAVELAATLDDPSVAAYIRPRAASVLATIIDAIEHEDEASAGGDLDVRALLREALAS